MAHIPACTLCLSVCLCSDAEDLTAESSVEKIEGKTGPKKLGRAVTVGVARQNFWDSSQTCHVFLSKGCK